MNQSSIDSSAQRVEQALHQLGLSGVVKHLEASTRTAVEAAAACNCELGQIVKSLVFQLSPSGRPVLILVSGSNRANESKISEELGEKLERATPDFVRRVTGYAIGGIPPVGHAQTLPTLIDEDLLQYPVVWAAAGTPHAVFPISPIELTRITQGKVIQVK